MSAKECRKRPSQSGATAISAKSVSGYVLVYYILYILYIFENCLQPFFFNNSAIFYSSNLLLQLLSMIAMFMHALSSKGGGGGGGGGLGFAKGGVEKISYQGRSGIWRHLDLVNLHSIIAHATPQANP